MKKVRLQLVKHQYAIFSITLIFLLSCCANEMAPTGGTKDAIPPKLLKSSPANETRNFKGKKIVLSFDEFLNYSIDVAQIQVTPEMKPAPKFFIEGKKLHIDLPKKLDSNATYNVMFGNSIKDINEGNAIPDFSFCFSTGDSLDVCVIKGTSVSLSDMKPVENIMVGLYTENTDFVKPLYYTNTNKAGEFSFRNIKRGRYTIAAFEDKNLNKLFDVGDGISGFLDSIINLKDTINNISLNLFPSSKGKILESFVPRGNKVDFAFSHPIEKVSVTSNPKNNIDFAKLNEQRDTLFYWYKNISADSIELALVINDSTTLVKIKNESNKDSLSFKKEKNQQHIASTGLLQVPFSNPIALVNRERITIIEDSNKIILSNKIEITTQVNSVSFAFSKKQGSKYSMLFNDSAFVDVFGNVSKRDTLKAFCPKDMEIGNLILKLNDDDTSFLIIEIMNDRDIAVTKKYLSPHQKQIKIEGLATGNYSVLGTFDENKNGYWDSGNFEKRIQPEKKVILKSNVTIKAGWDIEATINTKNADTKPNTTKENSGSKKQRF